jgi:hypothetical protein
MSDEPETVPPVETTEAKPDDAKDDKDKAGETEEEKKGGET